jgi:hypothetical protein
VWWYDLRFAGTAWADLANFANMSLIAQIGALNSMIARRITGRANRWPARQFPY